MTRFIAELIRVLEQEIPELKDKIQHGAVDGETSTPFAAFSTPEARPLRTFHGIVGFETIFEMILVGDSLEEIGELNKEMIKIIEREEIDGKRCRLVSFSSEFFPDYKLDGMLVTYKLK